ncbi:MAG: tetratricopeptide repeat protein, partial [Planctomycetota bacterium]
YRAATSAMQSMFGPEHPDTLIGRANLATALGNAGDYEGARTELKDILAVQQELLGAGNVNALITMNNLAMVNLELGRLDEAEDLLRTFVVGIEEVGAPVNVTFGRRNLGRVLTAAGKFEQAEIELTEAFTGTQQLLGPAQQAKSAGYLAELYEAWNKPDEAERWRTVEAELQ